ncbi:hypothetical protein BDZ94DRAFT_1241111 [Collybia nuda]|uniref:Uncharacterized protein n=1 Tax=Collybia nuda TaxID=64659 RepID=A0A9P5XWI3_9AGAR|nr:hypothetical protein BDZ94DRAFT_1241111 [Collybia nuda]
MSDYLITPLTPELEYSASTTAPSESPGGNRIVLIALSAFGGLISLGIIAICVHALVDKYKSKKSTQGNISPLPRVPAHNSLENYASESSNHVTESFRNTSMIGVPFNGQGRPLRKAREGPLGMPTTHRGGYMIDRRVLHKTQQRQGTVAFQEGTQSMTSGTRRVKHNPIRSSPPPSITSRQQVDPPRRPRGWDLSEFNPPQSAQSSTYPPSVLPEYYARSPSPPLILQLVEERNFDLGRKRARPISHCNLSHLLAFLTFPLGLIEGDDTQRKAVLEIHIYSELLGIHASLGTYFGVRGGIAR